MVDVAAYIKEDLVCTKTLINSLNELVQNAKEAVVSQLKTIQELESEYTMSNMQLQSLLTDIRDRGSGAVAVHTYVAELNEEDKRIAKLLTLVEQEVNNY